MSGGVFVKIIKMKEFEPQSPPLVEKIQHPPQKDEDWSEDQEDLSCDKGNHKERSIFNQPNHLKHWKKVSTQTDQADEH